MVEREEAEEHAFEVGTRLHDLEIVAPLSEGGMSAVWLAAVRGPSGERHGFRVIKCLRARVPDRQAYERMLLAEGRLAQRVDHPNVARVHGFGRHRGRPYVVMDLVQGVSLARIRSRLDVRGLRLPPSWIATLGAAYARGLHAAHRACDDEGRYLGLIHRDVSPGNLMLSVEGVPKIIDFGVAKATAVEAHSMVFKGTLRYAAPEQLRGDALDPRADLYGLGAVLYELASGAKLFDGWSYVQLADRTAPVADGVTTPKLDRLLRQCLDVRPEHRPRSALALAHAFERCVDPHERPSATALGRLVEGVRDAAPASFYRGLALIAVPTSRESRPTPSGIRVVARWEVEPTEVEGTMASDLDAKDRPTVRPKPRIDERSEPPGSVEDLEDDPLPPDRTGSVDPELDGTAPLDPTPTVARTVRLADLLEVDDELPTRQHDAGALLALCRRPTESDPPRAAGVEAHRAPTSKPPRDADPTNVSATRRAVGRVSEQLARAPKWVAWAAVVLAAVLVACALA